MQNNLFNLTLAIILSAGIIIGWHYFYEKPRIEKLAEQQKIYDQQVEDLKSNKAQIVQERDEAIAGRQAGRVKINTGSLVGSISLRGLRFDDLTLIQYKKDLSKDSKSVELLSPANYENAYFVEFGWLSQSSRITMPSAETIWRADSDELGSGRPVTFTWKSPEGAEFKVIVELDDNYFFTVTQQINNKTAWPASMQFYGLTNRNYDFSEKLVNILHLGPIAVVNSQLHEESYEDMKKEKNKSFTRDALDWIGISDKYWLVALVPDGKSRYSGNFSYAIRDGYEKYQADFVSPTKIVEAGSSMTFTHHLFAGAKKVRLLDQYSSNYDIKLFDRAIDFGWFYVLTKPVFYTLNFFYGYVGNFGISILIVTVIIKLLMFSLASRSYRSMKRMKSLQPEIEKIRELYADDKTRLNQEIIEFYRRKKVNPIAGCLPLFIQIPVFFSLYKVLYVTIEMRHAPFYGWVQDLSVADPTSILNLFGLLQWPVPEMLQIGAWPIIMAATMFLQQRMSPPPADQMQAQIIKFMPLIFLVMFSKFPAGLVIYWSWSNILSILQQYYINKR